MDCSKLRNRYDKNETEDYFIAYEQHGSKCVKIFRKAKCNYHGNLDLQDLTVNRKFWEKTVKRVFTDAVRVCHSHRKR